MGRKGSKGASASNYCWLQSLVHVMSVGSSLLVSDVMFTAPPTPTPERLSPAPSIESDQEEKPYNHFLSDSHTFILLHL